MEEKRRRGRPRKTEVDMTKAARLGTVDQIAPQALPDGPTGIVHETPDITPDAIKAAQELLERARVAENKQISGNLSPGFVEAMGPGRAAALVEEHGPFVKVEAMYSNFFAPDYEAGPQEKVIGENIHRYYRPKQIVCAQFDKQTRRRTKTGQQAWLPLRDFQKMEANLGEGTLVIRESSDGTQAA